MRSNIEKMLTPYGRWPYALVDKDGKVWRRCKSKGWFQRYKWDDRPHGGYCATYKRIDHHDFIGCEEIWNKKEAEIIGDAGIRKVIEYTSGSFSKQDLENLIQQHTL